MLGTFQKSNLRIELNASEHILRDSLVETSKLQQWLLPGRFSDGIPDKLVQGLTFTRWVGLIPIEHYVEIASDNCLRLILSQGIDGYHEWFWGDGWLQTRLEGISLLPLNLGQTLSLLSLRRFLNTQQPK